MPHQSGSIVDFANPYVISFPAYSGSASRWAEVRGRALDGDVSVFDPWDISYEEDAPSKKEFTVPPDELLRRARFQAPEHGVATASSFADWIYSLYRRLPSLQGMEKGRELEDLWGGNLKHNASFGRVNSSSWQLIYRGMGESDDNCTPYRAASLRVRGAALRCSPDLVYRHRTDSCAVIVEVKCTTKPLPRALWPNVWAQLWAYSKIDELAQFENLMVLAEIWAEESGRLVLRRIVRRNPKREIFDQFYSELFNIYRFHSSRH